MRLWSKSKILILGIFIGILIPTIFAALPAQARTSDYLRAVETRAVQVTEVYNDAVSGLQVDYFPVVAEPGLMSVSVSWSGSYDIDCYICRTASYTNYLARGYTTNNPETCSYTITTAGTYYIAVRMYTSSAPSTTYACTVKYYKAVADTTAPTVSISSPSDGATVSNTITISATASDNVGVTKVSRQIDSGSWVDDTTSPYSWSFDTTTLSNGAHTITVKAYDAAGNTATDIHTITVSNVGKVQTTKIFTDSVSGSQVDYFTISSVQPGLMSVSVSWSGSYDIDCYICTTPSYTSYLARGYTTNNPETCSYTITTAGTYYVAVRMYTSSAPSTAYTCTVIYYTTAGGDVTPPTVSITSPSNGATVQGTITISATASDNVGVTKVSRQIDSGAWADDTTSPYSWSWDTTSVGDGIHTVTVRAYDAASNTKDASVSVTVDNIQGTGGKYAVIVGISDYKAISDLSYCDEDATDWYNYLVNVCGYSSSDIIVLGDGHTSNYPKYTAIANEYNIKYYLNWLIRQSGEICFITSGHGSGDGSGSSYICPWDCGSGENGEDGDFYDTECADILEHAIADKVFVFIDHCFSGGFGPDLMAMANKAKVYLSTTCSDNGYGYDDSSHYNGAWTYYFLHYALITHFGSSPSTTMENAFDYALAAYPYSGGDTPEEYDGNTGASFTI